MLTRYSEPWLFLLSPDGGSGAGGAGGGAGGSGSGSGGAGAGGSGAGDGGTGGQGGSGGAGGAGNGQGAQGRVFSEDYVRALRDESAGHRTRAKGFETAIRTVLGIADGADLPQDLGIALTGLKTSGQQAAAEELTMAKAMYASGLFAAAGASKLANVDAAFALVAQAGYSIDVDLKSKTLAVKDKEGKQLADKDGKALTGQAAMGALVDKLVEVYPFLKGQGGGPSQVGGTTPPGGGGTEETPEQFGERMAKERAAARGGTKQSFWSRGAQTPQK